MKIVFFTNEYSHSQLPASGGVGSFLKTMAEGMTKLGHEVHVFGFSKRPVNFNDEGITFKFLKKYSKQFPLSEFLRSLSGTLNIKNAERYFLKKERQYLAKQLKTYCVKNDIDIIESFVFNGFTAFWDNSTPLVIRFHGSRGFWHHYLGAKKEVHKIFMEQLALENTPYTVAVSAFSAQAVKDIYNIKIDKIIPNGIDAKLFSPNLNLSEMEQSVFYFGTLSEAKGVDTLCQVFNTLIEAFPKATLHLIGRGSEFLDHLKQHVLSKKALQNMSYHGPKQLEELPDLLNQASVLVFPSRNETFGLIVTESMALGKPVIASNIPAFKEIITTNENGFIAESQEDYIKYISRMFTDSEEKKRISKNAREQVLDSFTKDIMIQKSIAYYQNILNT
ncbi:glycosyltransferase family 4 protein [Psychroserpens sp. SPM9]|uniref:glycosyltransferase family 4 protein n=1 Tax=Psychroserpens sp. SPM9 TaxID=2975598 RepID=UPI0021A4C2C4|nr:glycosyltransferase family 4 protein [Psychroserpens sp. SPM9]MDG5492367.1 glycosyltransferase family 4 protein [Psychroserpens sp. SPM9]